MQVAQRSSAACSHGIGGVAPCNFEKRSCVVQAVSNLRETLRAAADLIEGFKKKHWMKKVLFYSSTAKKFEGLFLELDRVLTICGFAA